MKKAIANMAMQSSNQFPATIYYAFKQSEVAQDGISSTGWATFLQAVVEAGYAVVGTWPLRTEMANRMIASGTNALANSVVLVCRKKEATAESITRAEFIRALKRELPPAIAELQAANIAPADMPQSAIGPGMGVFSRYKAVLESDDSPMSVKTALQLINRELDEYLGGIQGEFDADTRFAITWFEQNGTGKGITVSLTTLPAPAVFLSIVSSTRASSKALRVRSAFFRAMNSTTIGTRRTTTT
jgi:putative DNA methylase